MISYWLIGFGLVFLLISGLWLPVPAIYGVPWVPTREMRICRALQLAELGSGETLYDLGAGDGRVRVLAAGEFGALAIGIEIGPVQCALGWLRIWFNGSSHGPRPEQSRRIRMRWANFYKSDVSERMWSLSTPPLPRSLSCSRYWNVNCALARVVSIAADFPGWQPSHVDREMLIFVYRMPPTHVEETVLFPNGVQ